MRFHRLLRANILAALPFLIASTASAQPRLHAGAAFTFAIQPKSESVEYPGGTTWGGTVLLGGELFRRVAGEVEVSANGELTDEFRYQPFPDQSARVVWTRRDTFYTFQLRWRAGVLEPVAGLSYIRSTARRNARLIPSDQPYFDDRQSDDALAVAAGLDAAIKLRPRFDLVPTFRVIARPSEPEPFHNTKNAGPMVFRFGAGLRVNF
jgi:hypothetical protein